MIQLHIDIETYSESPLLEVGLHVYAAHPTTEITLFAYAFDSDPVEVIDLTAGTPLPQKVIKALTSPKVTKVAFNAPFEINLIRNVLGIDCREEQWGCASVAARVHGLPGGLDQCGEAMGLGDKAKMKSGKKLIRLFAVPRPANQKLRRATRETHPDEWAEFIEYCRMDVEAEREIWHRISGKMDERELWVLDQTINNTGLLLDRELIAGALAIDRDMREHLLNEMQRLTGMANPNSRDQLMVWLDTAGVSAVDVTKKTVERLLADAPTAEVAEVLRLRQQLAKSSISKYDAAYRACGDDSRLRGLFQFAGAGRTARWAGRIFQPQNLPRPPKWMEDWEEEQFIEARNLIATGDYELVRLIYDNVPEILSAMIRSIIKAPDGQRLIVADYSAIEARVLAWLAGETWRMEVFNTHGKIYEASASQMFKVPLAKIKKGNPEYALRQKGKVAELALGYQGGPNALITMGALDMGLAEAELPDIVRLWRNANPSIVQFWLAMEEAALYCVRDKIDGPVAGGSGIHFRLREQGDDTWLEMVLPSGRPLRYYRPHISPTGKLNYWGVNGYTKKWEVIPTYGGKLTENAVQGASRDCLAHSLLTLHNAGYPIVGHVHDEVISEMPFGKGSVEEMIELMSQRAPWMGDLPLTAAGYETTLYRKD